MKQWMVFGASAVIAWSALSGAVFAQERIYRCGNEYTNSAAQAKQRNCQVVEGGHVTVVHSSHSTNTKSRSTAASETKPANHSRAVQIDPQQQKARDSDAKSILQAELAKAQEKLGVLKSEFNEGNPVKSALELRNPQVFNERFEALKAQIARQESDVAGILRELARHTGG
jgi:hypothetical protein